MLDIFQGAGKVVPQDIITEISNKMRGMEQVPAFETTHWFAGGMYCRRMEIPAGSIIVSKTHKTDHFFVGCVGALLVAGQGGNFMICPGDIVPSPIGTRRIVMALTDVVVLTVHKTDKIDTDGLEEEIMEIDPDTLYDVNNRLKSEVLEWCGQQ